jgi:hypothetical protein
MKLSTGEKHLHVGGSVKIRQCPTLGRRETLAGTNLVSAGVNYNIGSLSHKELYAFYEKHGI